MKLTTTLSLYFLIFFSIFLFESKAQSYYDFTQTTGVYESIVNPSYAMTDSATIINSAWTIQLNFSPSSQLPRTAFGETISGNILGNKDGYIAALADSSDFTFDPFQTLLVSTDNSEFRFKDALVGTDSIFEMEWYKFGIQNHPVVDYVTFKIRFNLSKEVIEYWYGPSNITSTNPFSAQSPVIVLWKATKGYISTKGVVFLSGNPTNPTVSSNVGSINAFPANGTIYRFNGPLISGIKKVFTFQSQIDLWPNPAHDILNIDNMQDIKSLSIFSIDGKLYHQTEEYSVFEPISLINYPSGLYVVNCVFKDGSVGSTKLIVE